MSVGKFVGFVVSRSKLDVYALSFSSVVIGVNCFVFCGKVGRTVQRQRSLLAVFWGMYKADREDRISLICCIFVQRIRDVLYPIRYSIVQLCLHNLLILLRGHRVLLYTLFISSRRYWPSSLWSFIHRWSCHG